MAGRRARRDSKPGRDRQKCPTIERQPHSLLGVQLELRHDEPAQQERRMASDGCIAGGTAGPAGARPHGGHSGPGTHASSDRACSSTSLCASQRQSQQERQHSGAPPAGSHGEDHEAGHHAVRRLEPGQQAEGLAPLRRARCGAGHTQAGASVHRCRRCRLPAACQGGARRPSRYGHRPRSQHTHPVSRQPCPRAHPPKPARPTSKYSIIATGRTSSGLGSAGVCRQGGRRRT